jgi:hypothetical protein
LKIKNTKRFILQRIENFRREIEDLKESTGLPEDKIRCKRNLLEEQFTNDKMDTTDCISEFQKLVPPTPLKEVKTNQPPDAPTNKTLELRRFLANTAQDSDSESDYNEWDSDPDMDDEAASKPKQSTSRPKVDDTFLRHAAHLVDYLDQFIALIDSNRESTLGQSCLDPDVTCEYSSEKMRELCRGQLKVLALRISRTFAFLGKLVPEVSSLMADVVVRRKTNKIYSEIKKTIVRLKMSVKELYEVSEFFKNEWPSEAKI